MMLQSAVAYVVTVIVILALTKVALDAQVDAVRAEGAAQAKKTGELEAELQRVHDREEKRDAAAREAGQLEALMKKGDKRELLRMAPNLAKLDLSPLERSVFEETIRKARRELSIESYQLGIEHARAGRYHEATLTLREAIDLDPDAPYVGQASFELARSHRAIDQQRQAIILLTRLTEASGQIELEDDALLLLAECQSDIELYADAKETLRTFFRRFEKSPLALEAKRLQGELANKP